MGRRTCRARGGLIPAIMSRVRPVRASEVDCRVRPGLSHPKTRDVWTDGRAADMGGLARLRLEAGSARHSNPEQGRRKMPFHAAPLRQREVFK